MAAAVVEVYYGLVIIGLLRWAASGGGAGRFALFVILHRKTTVEQIRTLYTLYVPNK